MLLSLGSTGGHIKGPDSRTLSRRGFPESEMRPGQRAVEPRSNAAQTCSGQTATLQRGEDRPGCTDEALPPRGVCRPMNFVVAPRRHLGRLASMRESRESTTVLSAYRLSAARHPTSRAADRHLFVQRLGRPSVGGKSSAPLPLALGTDEPPGRWEVGGGSSKGPARGLEGGQWSLEQSPSSEAVTVSWYRGIAYARTLSTA